VFDRWLTRSPLRPTRFLSLLDARRVVADLEARGGKKNRL
jgi:hypothetical protein